MDNSRLIFGGILVCILLGIYVYLIAVALRVVLGSIPPGSFTPEMASTLTLIGGLVSALVIAELAVTTPGEPPGARILGAHPTAGAKRVVLWVVMLYLGVWTITGLAAFVWGFLRNQGLVGALTDLGQSWIGVAIAAGYSYFGIKPGQPTKQGGGEAKLAQVD
jgi:hypothetical protein